MTKSRLLSLLKKLVFIVFVLGCGETEQQGIIDPKRNVINPQLADNKKTSKIIFKSNRDENDEIYAINLNGTNLMKITHHPARDYYPSWAPDGDRIVFSSDRDGNLEIYTTKLDGTDVTRLTNHNAEDHDPTWSPDGNKIAFSSSRHGNLEIYALD